MNIGFTTPGHERIGGGPVAGILLDDVCRDFGEKQAVNHVTLEINKVSFSLCWDRPVAEKQQRCACFPVLNFRLPEVSPSIMRKSPIPRQ